MKVGVLVCSEMSDGIKVEWNVHTAIRMTQKRMVDTVPITKSTFVNSVKGGSMIKQIRYFIIPIHL
jgi:hypothetical protein